MSCSPREHTNPAWNPAADVIRYRHGAYEVVVDLGPDPVTGRRRQRSRSLRMPERKRTPREVLDAEAALRVQAATGLHSEGATLGELLDAWLANASANLSPTTVRGYRGNIEKHVRPALGKVKVAKLTTAQLDNLYRSLGDPARKPYPLRPATVRQVHAVIRRALHQAQRWGWVERNVAGLAEPPRLRTRGVTAPDRPTVEKLMAAADEDLGEVIRFAYGTGARRGECCGLHWSDLDLEVGTAHIARSIAQLGAETVVKAPKSGRARDVALGARLVESLVARREKLVARAARFDAELDQDGYVFSDALTGDIPLGPQSLTDAFKRLAEAQGLKVRLHDLRHAAVSHALDAGIVPGDAANQVGHASTRMTLDVYGHGTTAGQRAMAQHLDL